MAKFFDPNGSDDSDPPEGGSLDHFPFNIDRAPKGDELKDIFDEFGWDTWRDVVRGNDDFDPKNLRGEQYTTPGEAILEYYDRAGGFVALINIIYDEDSGLYSAYVDIDTP